MQLILITYCMGGAITFWVWLRLFINDSRTPLTDCNSWNVLLFAACFWPIAIPISLLEIGLKRQPTQPSLNYSLPLNPLPLGYLLRKAGLISESQLIQALEVQQTTHNYMKIGEIIASHGWLQQETIDFFADSLIEARNQPKQPIGQYLKSAKLLSDKQIEVILQEQHHSGLRFGEIAVNKGWVRRETVDFLLNYLQQKKASVILS